MMKNYRWFKFLFFFGIFLFFNSLLHSAPRYIEAIDATDSPKLREVYVFEMSIKGSIPAPNGEMVPYRVDFEFLFINIMDTNDTNDLRGFYGAATGDNVSFKSITIKIREKTARLEGGGISKICNPPMPRALNMMGLKPDGLLIGFTGPLGSESYGCQIQADPNREAVVLIRQPFKGKDGGWGPAELIARAPFK